MLFAPGVALKVYEWLGVPLVLGLLVPSPQLTEYETPEVLGSVRAAVSVVGTPLSASPVLFRSASVGVTFVTETLLVAVSVNSVPIVAVALMLCVLTLGLRYVWAKTGPAPVSVWPSPQETLYVGAAVSLTLGSDRLIESE